MRETLDAVLDLMLWRDGGQRQARRNAWRAMVADNLRARERAEVAAAMTADTAASVAAAPPVSLTHGAGGEGRVLSG